MTQNTIPSSTPFSYDANAINLVYECAGPDGEFGLTLRILPQAGNPGLADKITRARQLISEAISHGTPDAGAWAQHFGFLLGTALESPELGATAALHLSMYFGQIGQLAARAIQGGPEAEGALAQAQSLCSKSLGAQAAFLSRASFECSQTLTSLSTHADDGLSSSPAKIAPVLRQWSSCVAMTGGGKLAASACAQLIGNLSRAMPSLREEHFYPERSTTLNVQTLKLLGREIGNAFAQSSFERTIAQGAKTTHELKLASCKTGDQMEIIFLNAGGNLGTNVAIKTSPRSIENTPGIPGFGLSKHLGLQSLPRRDFGLSWGLGLPMPDGGSVPLDRHAAFCLALRGASEKCPASHATAWNDQPHINEAASWLEDSIVILREAGGESDNHQIPQVMRAYWGPAGDLAVRAMAGDISADARVEWSFEQKRGATRSGKTDHFNRAAVCRASDIALDILEQGHWSPAAFNQAIEGWLFVASAVSIERSFTHNALRDLCSKIGQGEPGRAPALGPSPEATELISAAVLRALAHDPEQAHAMRKQLFDALTSIRALIHTERGSRGSPSKPKTATGHTLDAHFNALAEFTKLTNSFANKTSVPHPAARR